MRCERRKRRMRRDTRRMRRDCSAESGTVQVRRSSRKSFLYAWENNAQESDALEYNSCKSEARNLIRSFAMTWFWFGRMGSTMSNARRIMQQQSLSDSLISSCIARVFARQDKQTVSYESSKGKCTLDEIVNKQHLTLPFKLWALNSSGLAPTETCWSCQNYSLTSLHEWRFQETKNKEGTSLLYDELGTSLLYDGLPWD